MRKLCVLLLLCSMGIVASACGSDDSDGGSGGSSGSSGANATFFGSCQKTGTTDICADFSCTGSNCDAFKAEAEKDCSGTWSTSKCKDGALSRCQVNTGMGIVYVNNYYYVEDKIEEKCNLMGGKLL